MIKVASLVGVSYSGKSSITEGLVPRLAAEGIEADVIKKDEAMRALGRERYGDDDETGGYSIFGYFRYGQIPSSELHAWMNDRVHASLDAGRLAILEGGTRTRTAQAETLAGTELDDDEWRIYLLQIPFREVIGRARQRRRESGRYDDLLPVAAFKLRGQYMGMRSADAPQPTDPDVVALDATLPTPRLVETIAADIFDSRAAEPGGLQ